MHDDEPVPSPCVRLCCLDDDDICLGCHRSMSEILRWSDASDAERRAILDNTRQRRAARRR